MKQFLPILGLLILLSGAGESPAADEMDSSIPGLFQQAVSISRYELPSEAIADWRDTGGSKPALVLFSFDPLLRPVPVDLRSRVEKLVRTGSVKELHQRGRFGVADPLLLPTQTADAALRSGLFSKFIWVFPAKQAAGQLDLERFRAQMRDAGFLNDEELASLSLDQGVIKGRLRDLPFSAIHYQQLQSIPEPFVLHIDLSFFRGLYTNEIKTPAYRLLRDIAQQLKALDLHPQTVSLSASTLEGANSLEVRFLINNLGELLEHPELLDAEITPEWQVRSEALYAGDMFNESKKIELLASLADLAPESAAAHYDQYTALLLKRQSEPALAALDQAVKRDPGYAAAYIDLAQRALREKDLELGLELLKKAWEVFPDNPFISLQMAHVQMALGQPAAARQSVERLPENWSAHYHPEIPKVISTLQGQIQEVISAPPEKDDKP